MLWTLKETAMTSPRNYLELDDILVGCYGEDEELSAWEVAFMDEVDTPFPATLLGLPVEVTEFRLGPNNAIQCHVKTADKQRWIGIEDLDAKGLPEDFRYYRDLYHEWSGGMGDDEED